MEWLTALAVVGLLTTTWDHHDTTFDPELDAQLRQHGIDPANPSDLNQFRKDLEQLAMTIDPTYIPAQWDQSRSDFHDPVWQRVRLLDTKEDIAQQREDSGVYTEAGPLYASSAPIANAKGFELGIVTRSQQTNTVQRTGIGFYLRSDHLCNQRFDGPIKLV